MLLYQLRRLTSQTTISPASNSIDSNVDWVEKGAVTPAKDQGQCGDCWAFSSTGGSQIVTKTYWQTLSDNFLDMLSALEGAYFLATGNLVSFSEQQLLDCANSTYGNQGCVGGRVFNSFKYVDLNGLCNETAYPYSGVQV